MPVLPIVDSDGKLLPAAQEIVLAVTTYPTDPKKQEEFLASALVDGLLRLENSAPALAELAATLPWLIPALYRSPTPDEVIEAAVQADASAWAAGEILLTMLTAAKHHPRLNVGPKMAVEVISGYQEEAGLVAASESTLWNSWRRFKTVAHFHAVRQLWMLNYEPPTPEPFITWRMGNLTGYLAWSEHIRNDAVSRRFLPFEDTWRTPDSLQLPPVEIELGPLLPELFEAFKNYRL
jgi:hypothetical protein